jgi:hypothetical protein
VEDNYIDLRYMANATAESPPPVNDRNLFAVLLDTGVVRSIYLVVSDARWPAVDAQLSEEPFLLRRADGSYGRRLHGSPYVVSSASSARLPRERVIVYMSDDAMSAYPATLLARLLRPDASDVVVSVESSVGAR